MPPKFNQNLLTGFGVTAARGGQNLSIPIIMALLAFTTVCTTTQAVTDFKRIAHLTCWAGSKVTDPPPRRPTLWPTRRRKHCWLPWLLDLNSSTTFDP